MPMSYTSLVADKSTPGSIKSWMNYGKIDSEGVLEDAQTMIYERLRVREMRVSDLFPVRVGAASIDVPDGFLDPILVRNITSGCDLQPRDEAMLEQMRTYTGTTLDSGAPAYYSIVDEAITFECRTSEAWTMKAVWYGMPDPLSASNDKNFLTRRYPHLLRMACLAVAARHNHDDDIFAREQKLLFIEIDEIGAKDEMSRSTHVPVEGS